MRQQMSSMQKGNNNSSAQTMYQNQNRHRNPRPTKPTDMYCWTHGFRISHNHNSQECRTPDPNHQMEAMATNRLVGSRHVFIPGHVTLPETPQSNPRTTPSQTGVTFAATSGNPSISTLLFSMMGTPSVDDTTTLSSQQPTH